MPLLSVPTGLFARPSRPLCFPHRLKPACNLVVQAAIEGATMGAIMDAILCEIHVRWRAWRR